MNCVCVCVCACTCACTCVCVCVCIGRQGDHNRIGLVAWHGNWYHWLIDTKETKKGLPGWIAELKKERTPHPDQSFWSSRLVFITKKMYSVKQLEFGSILLRGPRLRVMCGEVGAKLACIYFLHPNVMKHPNLARHVGIYVTVSPFCYRYRHILCGHDYRPREWRLQVFEMAFEQFTALQNSRLSNRNKACYIHDTCVSFFFSFWEGKDMVETRPIQHEGMQDHGRQKKTKVVFDRPKNPWRVQQRSQAPTYAESGLTPTRATIRD